MGATGVRSGCAARAAIQNEEAKKAEKNDAARIPKLERAVKAAISLRRALIDSGPQFKSLFASRAAVEEYDKVMAELTDGNQHDGT